MIFGKNVSTIERRVQARLDKQYAQKIQDIRQQHLDELDKKDHSWKAKCEEIVKKEKVKHRRRIKEIEIKFGVKLAQLETEVKSARATYKLFRKEAFEVKHLSESLSTLLNLEYRARLDRYRKIEGHSDAIDPIINMIQGKKGRKIEFKLGEDSA